MSNMSQELIQKLNMIESVLLDLDQVDFTLFLSKILKDRAEFLLSEEEEKSLAYGIKDIQEGNFITLKTDEDIRKMVKSARKDYV